MSTMSTDEKRALFSDDGTAWADGSPLRWSPDDTVAKIVIGQPPRGEQTKPLALAAALPADLAHRYPHLTHLHLWRIGGLTELPFLPAGLKCLDVRGCGELATLPPLPAGLETLVIEDCPRTSRPERTEFAALSELSVRGCSSLSEDWLHAVLKNSPRLSKLDASNCPRITRLPALHLWDFGGQEIYHNTHRLFMSKGAVFVVVWNPAQDGRQPEPNDDRDYQDEWRPLQYWLDFIHLACPHKPRIAIVCSHHAGKTDALESQWKQQVDARFHDECQCFYIDSLDKAGELGELETWLQDEVGGIVAAQGVAVPAYWEVAQELVESWVQRLSHDLDFAKDHNQMTADIFRQELHSAIQQAVAEDRVGRYTRLEAALASGEFELTMDRLHRTLGFLTHSGWLYWDLGLFESRVIVGQRWALDGLYAILDRRPDSSS